jgi:dipeptidyl aminopeptidase/acylaminoacyl peptidase
MGKLNFLIMALILTAMGIVLAQPVETPMPKNGKIAFEAHNGNYSGDTHIYTINADGTNLQRFEDGECETYNPQWSPDGKSFAYYLQCKGEDMIHKISTEDRHVEIKGISDLFFHNWSPDGRKILLAKDTKLFVADAEGTNLKEIFGGWRQPHYHYVVAARQQAYSISFRPELSCYLS